MFSLLLGSLLGAPTADVVTDISAPAGFKVTLYADHKLATDIYCLTFDPKGRAVVSGRGYIRLLIDSTGAGRADRAVDFANNPKDGAMGLLHEGKVVYAVGDGGLLRFRDENQDDQPDGPPEYLTKFKTGNDHDGHAIHRGPDGWLYLLCGNNAKITGHFAGERSPVRRPIAGCVVRFAPDFSTSEIVCDGLRNAYAMDFNSAGDLFTFDSDNERCVGLPWYEFTRFYHLWEGGQHGWLNPQRADTWRLSADFLDVVPALKSIARGSPTGVVCYRHGQFPLAYHEGFFLADWTFGKVYFANISAAGSTYSASTSLFLESKGENGFSPTALAVDPKTGALFIAVGGRGARGGVYRVEYTVAANPNAKPTPFQPSRRILDAQAFDSAKVTKQANAENPRERLDALRNVLSWQDQMPAERLTEVVHSNWEHTDRQVRKKCIEIIERAPAELADNWLASAKSDRAKLTWACAFSARSPKKAFHVAWSVFFESKEPTDRFDAVRCLQLSAGGIGDQTHYGTVWEGYSRHEIPFLPTVDQAESLCDAFPTHDPKIDRELARLLSMLRVKNHAVLDRMSEVWTEGSNPIDDVHYLICFARIQGARLTTTTERIAKALLGLDKKLADRKIRPDRNWPLRVRELHLELCKLDSSLNDVMALQPNLGRPEHYVFAQHLGFPRERAIPAFLRNARSQADFVWSSSLIRYVRLAPRNEWASLVRQQWENLALQDAIVEVLSLSPELSDRILFLEAIESTTPTTAQFALTGLERLAPVEPTDKNLFALFRFLVRLGNEPQSRELAERMSAYLRRVTGEKLDLEPKRWLDWLAKSKPEVYRRVLNPDTVDLVHWGERLNQIDWVKGSENEGSKLFRRLACATCHTGGSALGPDLAGAADRFSRGDLFNHILAPSREISSRYQATAYETSGGKTYHGVPIYEAVDSLILQIGPDDTVRLNLREITNKKASSRSLMPTGLLDKCTDQEIASLYVYLRSLKKPETTKP